MPTPREQILTEYTIENGIIQDAGKFESEALFAPHFHDRANYGEELSWLEDGCGEYVSLVEISDKERSEFPELGAARYVLVIENDQGFVSVDTVDTEKQADEIRADYEREDEDEDEDENEDEDEHPNVGERRSCERCGQDIEFNGTNWHDRGLDTTCGSYMQNGELINEDHTKPHYPYQPA